METTTAPRPIHVIAREITRVWRDKDGNSKVYFGAVPYLQAMHGLSDITDTYGYDDAKDVVMYFLSNASTWRGEDAKRIKQELKKMCGLK
jgi:hypothetical protein